MGAERSTTSTSTIRSAVTKPSPSFPSLTATPFGSRPMLRPGGEAYLQLPAIDLRISRLAEQITASAPSNYEKALAIEQYLRAHFGYTLDLGRVRPQDPLAYFLFERKEGHCEYFASSMAVMLRTLGIPSRIVNGFRGGEFNDLTGQYVVRASNAHSWVEAYFPAPGGSVLTRLRPGAFPREPAGRECSFTWMPLLPSGASGSLITLESPAPVGKDRPLTPGILLMMCAAGLGGNIARCWAARSPPAHHDFPVGGWAGFSWSAC